MVFVFACVFFCFICCRILTLIEPGEVLLQIYIGERSKPKEREKEKLEF